MKDPIREYMRRERNLIYWKAARTGLRIGAAVYVFITIAFAPRKGNQK